MAILQAHFVYKNQLSGFGMFVGLVINPVIFYQ
jgi:hypothetical protein